MNRSYRLGLLIVFGTVATSAALILAANVSGRLDSKPTRAGQDLGDHGYPLGDFRLVERSGRTITQADLGGDVWIAGFIFTHCPSSCPRITSVMKGLQGTFDDSGVKLVSLSVDPDRDTPIVLSKFADGFGADKERWWFLTGDKKEIYELILERFHISVSEIPASDRKPGIEDISHSSRLVLVDRGNVVVGVFDSEDPGAVKDLIGKARRKASWARRLPLVNATLNGSCAVLLLMGWIFILAGQVKAHAACMIASVAVSAVFLASYLTYHFEVGSVSFQGSGASKVTYLTILLSHTILATFGVVPLVALTLTRAIQGRFDKHASIARVTFPIWLYVSITGVIIYLMLYQMPISP